MSEDEESPILEQISKSTVVKKIGWGSGVSVYRVEEWTTDGVHMQPIVVKKVNDGFLKTGFMERLRQEAEILRELKHPNIVGFKGFLTTRDGGMLLLEECKESLGDFIERKIKEGDKALKSQDIHKVLLGVSRGLWYLHNEMCLLHGDIKSHNILIKDGLEEVKLCDFGVSVRLDSTGCGDPSKYIGTLAWSAPEALNGGPLTDRADIFSLGLTIFEMLTLSSPDLFEGDPCHDEGDFGPRECRPRLPHSFSTEYYSAIEIYNWCTEPYYKDRPTAEDLVFILESYCLRKEHTNVI